MRSVEFSEVQLFNLSALITIRDCIQRDAISACCKFGISEEMAKCFSALSIDQILVFVANIGHETLFTPRQDLVSLLSLPTSLAGPITAVHPSYKTQSVS